MISNISDLVEMEHYSYKMRSIFFSSIAHELRTPMNSILPICDSLDSCINDVKGKSYLRILKNSAYHLSFIVEDALDMSRIENDKFVLNN